MARGAPDESIKDLLEYDASTGVIRWKIDRCRGHSHHIVTSKAGEIAGSLNGKGYIRINVGYRELLAHRLAWWFMTGEWPPMVDHKDGCPTNNVFSNLRAATAAINTQNQRRAHIGSRTGVLGVSPNGWGKFTAMIGHQRKVLYIGTYLTVEEAHAAYVAKKRELHEGCTL